MLQESYVTEQIQTVLFMGPVMCWQLVITYYMLLFVTFRLNMWMWTVRFSGARNGKRRVLVPELSTNISGVLKLQLESIQAFEFQSSPCTCQTDSVFNFPPLLVFSLQRPRFSMQSFFDSWRICRRVCRKRGQSGFLSGSGGNTEIRKGCVFKNNWGIKGPGRIPLTLRLGMLHTRKDPSGTKP